MRVVMTSGVFDLFHIGHLNILERSKLLGDHLIVGVLTDDGAAAYKSKRPTIGQYERLRIIQSLRCVNEAYLQDSTDPTPLLERFRPDIFTHGNDWDCLLKGNETIEELGINFVLLPYTKGVSTTEIYAKIKGNNGF